MILQNQSIIMIESKKQLDQILHSNPGKGQTIDILLIHESIKELIKTEKYFPIWASLMPMVSFEKSKIYYYTN